MAGKPLCSIPDCNKPHKAHGLCSSHYMRKCRYGDPLEGGTDKGEAQRYYREVVLLYDGKECLIWPFSRRPNGYAQLNQRSVYRMVCEERHGPPPTPKHQAAHSCGKGSSGCVAGEHLDWKTPSENNLDKRGHGTAPTGERNPKAKLTAADVGAIRSSNDTSIILANQYGVGAGQINRIRSGRQWRD